MRIALAVLAMGAAAVSLARPAHADSPRPMRVDLEWDAPEQCPDRAAVLAEVGALLDRDPLGAADVTITVRAQVRRDPDGAWSVLMQTQSPGASGGERTLRGDACTQLVSAAALVIALAIDPDAVASHLSRPSDSPAPSGPLLPSVTPSSAVVSCSPPLREVRSTDPLLRFALRAQIAADYGTLGPLNGGASLALAALLRHVRVELRIGSWLPQNFGAPSGGAIWPAFVAGLAGCYGSEFATLEVAGCVAAESGLIVGQGYGVTPPAMPAMHPWFAALTGPMLLWHIQRHVGLWAGLEAGVTPSPPRFTITVHDGNGSTTENVVYQGGLFVARAAVGVEIHF